MANLPISQLPSASVPSGSEVLPIVQGGVTEQITVTNLAQGIFKLGLPITASTISQTDYIDFNTGSATPAWKSGRVFWDNTDGCMAVYNAEAAVTLQVGQENWTRIYNPLATTITNGTAVRLSGTHGDVPEVALAQSLAISGSVNLLNQILGLATHDIEAGTFGFITTQGLVRGLNTNAFNDGDTLFVGTGSAGVIQNSPPSAPYEIIPIGVCVKASPGASGIVYVAVQEPIDFSDLSSVLVTGSYDYGDLWVYKPSGSLGVWSHQKQLSGSYGVTGSWNVTGSLTLNNSNLSTAWTSYTPTWTALGSNPSIGNGTITGAYKVIGKTCFVRGRILMGSSTTYGSGAWLIGLPFTASSPYGVQIPASLLNNGAAWYSGLMNGGRNGNSSYSEIQVQNTGGTADGISSTYPFTWGDTDDFSFNGSYEIA